MSPLSSLYIYFFLLKEQRTIFTKFHGKIRHSYTIYITHSCIKGHKKRLFFSSKYLENNQFSVYIYGMNELNGCNTWHTMQQHTPAHVVFAHTTVNRGPIVGKMMRDISLSDPPPYSKQSPTVGHFNKLLCNNVCSRSFFPSFIKWVKKYLRKLNFHL